MATNNDLLMDKLNASYFPQNLWLYGMIWLPRTTDNSTHFAQSLKFEVSRVDCICMSRGGRNVLKTRQYDSAISTHFSYFIKTVAKLFGINSSSTCSTVVVVNTQHKYSHHFLPMSSVWGILLVESQACACYVTLFIYTS